jgi:hypothetical protein
MTEAMTSATGGARQQERDWLGLSASRLEVKRRDEVNAANGRASGK